jgi:catechol-2,3-dioxygenase
LTPQRKGLRFSHIGLFAKDLAKQAAFYERVLDFTMTDHGHLEGPQGPIELVFLSRDPDEHHQIVMVSGRPDPLAFNVINQISLKADSVETLQDFYHLLRDEPVDDLVAVTHGNAISVYFRDPEGNRIELYVDTPWYVSQPCRVSAPITAPAAELMAWAEEHARKLPGFRPRREWRNEMARRMGVDEV